MTEGEKRREGIVLGNPSMLRTVLALFISEQGLRYFESPAARDNPHFTFFNICVPDEEPPQQRWLGFIALQSIAPTLAMGWGVERTLIMFGTQSKVLRVHGAQSPEDELQFWEFCDALIGRLLQLGFVDLPPPPKGQIGFPTSMAQGNDAP